VRETKVFDSAVLPPYTLLGYNATYKNILFSDGFNAELAQEQRIELKFNHTGEQQE